MNEIDAAILRLSGQGYCCSQILLRLALDMQGRDCPALIRAASGLCNGLGAGSGTCGALTGGACVLGLYAGKGEDGDEAHPRLALMLSELEEWFTHEACAEHPGIRCEDILGGQNRIPDMQVCGRLVTQTWHQVLNILQEQGCDPFDENCFSSPSTM